MDKKISEIFDYGDEIVVALRGGKECDPAEIKELTMKRIHDEEKTPIEYRHTVKKARPAWRTALIAAIAAVLLAGAALAVYQYTVRDAAIEDVPTRDSELYDWKAGETETRLSLSGFSDSPEYKAYVEWTDWNRTWNAEHPDPWKEIGEDDSYYETPDNYLTYEAYFAEQGEKLDEIAEKYGLSLLGEHIFFRTESQLCKAIGAGNIIADGYDIGGDYLFPNGTFKAVGDTVIGGKSVSFGIWNSVKGSFIPLSGLVPEDYTEWNYTTRDGAEVILITDNLRGSSTVIAALSGCYVTAEIDTGDAEAAEAFADAIDLASLEACFGTESARLTAAQTVADYLTYRETATTVDEIGEDEAAVLSYLGDWYPTALPEGVTLDSMGANAPDHFEDFYRVGRFYYGKGGMVEFFYRELEPLDGTNDETRLELSNYSLYYDAPEDDPELLGIPEWVVTPCTLDGYEAVMAEPNGAGAGDYQLVWLDTDRQLLFRVGMYDTTYDAVIAAAESVTGTAPETPPVRNASTREERFRHSLMPLSRVNLMYYYGDDQGVLTKRVLAALGNYGLTELPDGADNPTVYGWRRDMYEYYWDGRADWGEVWKTYHSDPELGFDGLTLNYKRFDDGRTAEAYEMEKRYDDADAYADIADVVVGGNDGYIKSGDFYAGQTILEWYDTDCDLIFELSVNTEVFADMTEDDLIAFAESVTEQPWTGEETGVYKLPDAERVLAELGSYTIPGASYGSVVSANDVQTENWTGAPLWFVEDGPYVNESASATYADGLMLTWQRTWADTARKAENGEESFAAITKYLLACDDSGAVQTGLSVNGHDAICINYPFEEAWSEAHTELMWYDEDAGLIFTLADYPEEGGEARTAAQLIALAESVAAR